MTSSWIWKKLWSISLFYQTIHLNVFKGMFLNWLNMCFVRVYVDISYVSKTIFYGFISHHFFKVIDAWTGSFILYFLLCFYTMAFFISMFLCRTGPHGRTVPTEWSALYKYIWNRWTLFILCHSLRKYNDFKLCPCHPLLKRSGWASFTWCNIRLMLTSF